VNEEGKVEGGGGEPAPGKYSVRGRNPNGTPFEVEKGNPLTSRTPTGRGTLLSHMLKREKEEGRGGRKNTISPPEELTSGDLVVQDFWPNRKPQHVILLP